MKKMLNVFILLQGISISIYGNCYIFSSEKEAQDAFSKSKIVYKEIIDPSYDQTFKMIMSTDPDKVQFLISFLNSIYFPGAGEEDQKIRRIEALEKENTQLGESSRTGITICDVACKCIYYADHSSTSSPEKRKRKRDELEAAFDLEMQRLPQEHFLMRLMEYGQNLHIRNNMCTKALGLLNFRKPKKNEFEDKTSSYAWCKIDPKTNIPERLDGDDNKLELVTLDLRQLSNSEEIYVNGQQLNIVGITWLKLFGIKQWCKSKDGNMKYEIYYPEEETDKAIKDAIEILSQIDQETYDKMKRLAQKEKDVLNTAKREGTMQSKFETAKNFLKMGLSIEQVAQGTGLSVEEVDQLK